MSEENIGLAAQCWCDEETENFVMIPELALAFAKRLDEKDKRIAELEKALDKLIDQASMCDSWECFPSDWLDEAYESLSKGGAK